MKATSKSGYGRGWHKQSVRHSLARKTGRAGGTYADTLAKMNSEQNRKNEFYNITRKDVYKRMKKEKLVGGLGDYKPDSSFDKKSLEKGIKVELEHTKDRQIAKEISKDHLSEDASYYDKLEQMEKTPTIPPPPLESANNLPVQISLIVPSTSNVKDHKGDLKSKKIKPQQFTKRVNEVKKEFIKRFGADTAVQEVGSYTMDGKLVKERGVIVESSTTIPRYKKNIAGIARFTEAKRKSFGNQDTMALKVEGRLFVTPKKSYIHHDRKTYKKPIPVT